MKNIQSKIKRDLMLLIQSPKDFLYSYKYSGRNVIKVIPYNPDTYDKAKKLIKQIKEKCPEIDIYLIGATGLQIEGSGDIDIYVTAKSSNTFKVLEVIESILGEPLKVKNGFCEWNSSYCNYPVELVLTTPKNKHFQKQILIFNIIKNNSKYLKDYQELKRSLDSISERESVRRKMEFFNRILRNLD